MPIEVGHIIEHIVPDSRKHIVSGVRGVVYKKTYNESLKSYSLYVKPVDKMGLSVIMTAYPVYGDSFKCIGEVDASDLDRIQKEMAPFAGPPQGKKSVKRGGIKVREDSLLKPNTVYGNIKGYVKTKKDWFTIERTTAKMAFFNGGKCSINNVTEIQ